VPRAGIRTRVAIDNNNTTTVKVKNVVIVGAVAQNLREIVHLQSVNLPLLYAENVLDHNHDRVLSVSEANKIPFFRHMVGNLTLRLTQNITTTTTNETTTIQQLNSKYNANKDVDISINNEFKPKLVVQIKSLSVGTQIRSVAVLVCTLFGLAHTMLCTQIDK
jgi:hypothetical protein